MPSILSLGSVALRPAFFRSALSDMALINSGFAVSQRPCYKGGLKCKSPKSETKMRIRLVLLILCLSLVSGCSIYKIDVQQGNVVTQKMLDKLKPGMDKGQVRFVLGSPLITDAFTKNRWDYYYSYRKGARDRDQRERITVIFDNEGRLLRLEGGLNTKPRKDKPSARIDSAPHS